MRIKLVHPMVVPSGYPRKTVSSIPQLLPRNCSFYGEGVSGVEGERLDCVGEVRTQWRGRRRQRWGTGAEGEKRRRVGEEGGKEEEEADAASDVVVE